MIRIGTAIHGLAAAIFAIAGLVIAWLHAGRTPPPLDSMRDLLDAPLTMFTPPAPIPSALAQSYSAPDNPVMWALLLAIWSVVVLDAVGQWIDPGDPPPRHAGVATIWRALSASLILASGALWFLRDNPGWLAPVMACATAAAILASRRAAGRQRPAIGFFAGWLTAVTSAALADAVSNHVTLSSPAIATMAILPAAAIGIGAQIWIGPSIGYSAALIWAFCGLAVSTMGTDPIIALSATLGIACMAVVLIRAAS